MIIYLIKNTANGKCYIGQTLRPFKIRKSEHLNAAANISRTKHPSPLHSAINEFGSGKFVWEILEECNSSTHLNEREKFYIKLLNTQIPNGYNQTSGGYIDGSMSEDVRKKIANTVVELHKDPAYRAKVYPKLKGRTPPNKGQPMSDLQKKKVSDAKKAVYADPNYLNPNIGQKRTDEQKARIREGQGKRALGGDKWYAAHSDQYTPAIREKMRLKKLGKKPINTKKVLCLETGEVFNGLTDTSKALNINRQSIYLQIKGILKSAGGKHFKYID